jgi:signal transduction histidine kinase
MNVMIVDDERVQLRSLKRGLKSVGYDVVEAINAKEALSCLDEHIAPVDIVITDYAMPGMNGIELLKEIRIRESTIPVIMMTAYGEKDLVIEALRNKCDSFLEKPFVLEDLIQEINRAGFNRLKNTKSDQITKLIPRFVHQLNNPLMAILGSAELSLIQKEDPERLEAGIRTIIESVNKMQEINRQILKLGLEEKNSFETVDVTAVLKNSLNMFKELITFKEITLEKKVEGSLYVMGNKFQIEQLLKNLILNAIDAMDNIAEKRLKIDIEKCETSESVCVKIEDTGCGIPKASREKIFSPYYTRKKNGTGLGLAIAKDIVEQHKGKLKIESEVEKGTIFIVTLPEY